MFISLALIAAAPAVSDATRPMDPGDAVICRREPKTGTRFLRTLCGKRSAWENVSETNRRDLVEMRSRSVALEGR
jgi:hypothetical protein